MIHYRVRQGLVPFSICHLSFMRASRACEVVELGKVYMIGIFVFFLDWDAPTLHIQALIQPQVEAQQAHCFFQIRQFSKDIQDSGMSNTPQLNYLLGSSSGYTPEKKKNE